MTVLRWKRKAEQYLRASDLNYTIVRPGGLRDGIKGIEDIVFEQGDRKGGRHVIVADVATVAVEVLKQKEALGKTFEMFSDETKPPHEWRGDFARLTPDSSAISFRDCDACPSMVTIPPGDFMIGSSITEPGRMDHEGPQRRVIIERPFAVGKFEVTFEEWDSCVAERGCRRYRPDDLDWGRERRPVINVNWDDIKAYLEWLSAKSGHPYRLLSEAEWEYAARAFSKTAYAWGSVSNHNMANYGTDTCCTGATDGTDIWAGQTAPVGSFPPNAFGLFDMAGNVYERVLDCWNPSYVGAPLDGSPRLSGDCSARVVRGGSWISSPELIRSAERDAYNGYYRSNVLGFRVARDIKPGQNPGATDPALPPQ